MPSVAPHELSPNIGNYYIGRGIVSLQLTTDSGYVDAGNCTEITITVKPTVLPHYSSRVGVRTKDFTTVTELEGTLDFKLEEFTARNVGFALLGSVADSPPGTWTIDMFSTAQLFCAFKFQGTNTVGPIWNVTCPLVQITPKAAISLISAGSGAWGDIDLQGDILKDTVTGQFCIATCTDITSP
jgi:hypothetical protein